MIRIAKSVTYGSVVDETMIVNSENGAVLRIDECGSKIWKLIYDGVPKEGIISHFVSMFPAQKKEIEEDVNSFFEELMKEGILEEE